MFGLPDRRPSPVRLLVESQGLTLDQLRRAVLEELDQDRDPALDVSSSNRSVKARSSAPAS